MVNKNVTNKIVGIAKIGVSSFGNKFKIIDSHINSTTDTSKKDAMGEGLLIESK